MRVLVLTHYFPAHRGGVEAIAGELVKRLPRRGVEVEWIASDTDSRPGGLGPRVRCRPARTWNFFENRVNVPYPLWSPWALAAVGRAVARADAVHLHDSLYAGNVFGFACARVQGKPILVTQHIGAVPYRNFLLRALHDALNRSVGRWVLGGADRVVFYSAGARRYFSRFVNLRGRARTVLNGVDTRAFFPVSDAKRARIRRKLGLRPDRPMLLFVGRFVEKKGLAILGDLAGLMTGVNWTFAGWGPIDPRRWRRPNVRVLGGLKGGALAPLYQAADLLVLPSRGEGYPLVVQEAMACGTPAAVSEETARSYPPARKLVFSAPVGDGRTAVRWRRLLEGALADRRRLAGLRGRVAGFARKRWDWEACADRYHEILLEIAPGAATGGSDARDRRGGA